MHRQGTSSPRLPRLILVTGSPRSGTTPIGTALSHARGARSLYEPLNGSVGDRRVHRYFEVPGSPEFSVAASEQMLDDIRGLRLSLRPGIFDGDSAARKMVKRVTGSRTKATYRGARLLRPATLIWKDPFAVFWLKVLADHFEDTPVIVTHRPAVAVAGSFARLGWSFDVDDLVRRYEQSGETVDPRVMGFREAADVGIPALNGAFLWALVYSHLLREHPDSLFVGAQSMADHPAWYRDLFQAVGLSASERTMTKVTTVPEIARRSKRDAGPRAHTSRRNIQVINQYWKSVVDPEHAALISDHLAFLDESLLAASWAPAGGASASG